MTFEYTQRAVRILGGKLAGYHAVLVENYSSADSKDKAKILLDAGLPANNFMVYTNPYRSSNQTFGVRFSDGLFGEVHVREQTQALTETIAENDFLEGFNTVPPRKSQLQAIQVFEPYDLFNAYLMLFSLLDDERSIEPDKIVCSDAVVQKSRISEHGNKILRKFLAAVQRDPEIAQIRRALKLAYGTYGFSALR